MTIMRRLAWVGCTLCLSGSLNALALEAVNPYRTLSTWTEGTRGKAEFAKFCRSWRDAFDDRVTARAAVAWLNNHREEFTLAQRAELSALAQAGEASPDVAVEIRRLQELDGLEAASVGEKEVIFRAAVREGKVSLKGALTLNRVEALLWAAEDGIEAFEADVEKYASEIDSRMGYEPGGLSEQVKWTLRMRGGAQSREDARRIHVERLKALDAKEFSQLMQESTAFRRVTLKLAEGECGSGVTPGCISLAELALRSRADAAKGTMSDWVDQLIEVTRRGIVPAASRRETAEGH